MRSSAGAKSQRYSLCTLVSDAEGLASLHGQQVGTARADTSVSCVGITASVGSVSQARRKRTRA